MTKFAAIIPAAGYSSRMGLFKPLLPLGDQLVIERPVTAFLEAGIADVYVVIGHHAHLLKPVIERLGVKWVENKQFRQGMYSSIQAGVEALPVDADAFFLLPADTPLVSAETIRQLSMAYEKQACDVIYPVCDGLKGHPPLITTSLRPLILHKELEGGLKVLLQTMTNTEMTDCTDRGILKDLDTEEDYRSMVPPVLSRFPTKKECGKILTDYLIAHSVIDHAKKVAELAGILALHLNSCGHRIHLAQLQAACLLHDIAKGQPQHAKKGAELIESLGFAEVASIVATHMDLPETYCCKITEHTLLYVADKMTKGVIVLTPDERKTMDLQRFEDNHAAKEAAVLRLDKASTLLKYIEDIIGVPVKKILNAGDDKR